MNVVFSLFNERECMEKGSIEPIPNTVPSILVVYLVFSADQNGQFNNCNNLAKERVANVVLGVVVKFM